MFFMRTRIDDDALIFVGSKMDVNADLELGTLVFRVLRLTSVGGCSCLTSIYGQWSLQSIVCEFDVSCTRAHILHLRRRRQSQRPGRFKRLLIQRQLPHLGSQVWCACFLCARGSMVMHLYWLIVRWK